MKQQILILMLALLLIGNIIAIETETSIGDKPIQLCKTTIDKSSATEKVTQTVQSQVMETKTITRVNPNYLRIIKQYGLDLHNYRRLTKEQQSKTEVPKLDLKNLKQTISTTIQVPLTRTKTSYSFDWTSLKIIASKYQVPIYETKTVTTNQIKSGYNFDSDTGTFYTMASKEKC